MLFVIAYFHVGGTRDGRRAWNRNEVFLKAMSPPAIGFFVAWIGGGAWLNLSLKQLFIILHIRIVATIKSI